MPNYTVTPISVLIEQFERLPGIGSKSARRLAYHIMKLSKGEIEEFSSALRDIHLKVKYCKICSNFTDEDVCSICSDKSRSKLVICVVEEAKDALALERTQEFDGVYHVLHGAISPLSGIGPDDLTIKELLTRISSDSPKEIIMATNPDVEGEATAMYISKILKPFGIKVSRLAYGIPVGADIEYADEITLSRALRGRCEI
ncbi:MAG: recombination mediator RecR [Oscillospiraceae bacterium]|nr:recombination mediator RecR [Oscillospiraceae bacterium]